MLNRIFIMASAFLLLSCVFGTVTEFYTDDIKEVQRMKQDTAIRVLKVEQHGEGSVKIYQVEYVRRK
jgi:hypothetical protein